MAGLLNKVKEELPMGFAPISKKDSEPIVEEKEEAATTNPFDVVGSDDDFDFDFDDFDLDLDEEKETEEEEIENEEQEIPEEDTSTTSVQNDTIEEQDHEECIANTDEGDTNTEEVFVEIMDNELDELNEQLEEEQKEQDRLIEEEEAEQQQEEKKPKRKSPPRKAKKEKKEEETVKEDKQTIELVIDKNFNFEQTVNTLFANMNKDEEWLSIEHDLRERLNAIVIPKDISPQQVKVFNSEISNIEQTMVFLKARYSYMLETIVGKNGMIELVKQNNMNGSNDSERKINASKACMHYVVDGKPIDLFRSQWELNERVLFLTAVEKRIKSLSGALITASGALKLERELLNQ